MVDDDRWLRDILAELLQAEGFSVLQASNGHTAVVIARDSRPDVIVLDVALPPCSGLAGLDELRENPRTASVLVLLMSGVVDLRTQTAVPTAQAVLRKPPDVGKVIARIRHVKPPRRAIRADCGRHADLLPRMHSPLGGAVGSRKRRPRRASTVDPRPEH